MISYFTYWIIVLLISDELRRLTINYLCQYSWSSSCASAGASLSFVSEAAVLTSTFTPKLNTSSLSYNTHNIDKQFCNHYSNYNIYDRYSNARRHGAVSSQYNNIKVYWINSEYNTARRRYMETQFKQLGLSSSAHHRIDAIYPNSSDYRLLMLEKPCRRNTDRDIAVILSHLRAIYTAVYDPDDKHNDLAMIMEDDVKFLYDINYKSLVRTAPQPFGVLQLVTSSPEALKDLYNRYEYNRSVDATPALWTHNPWTATVANGKAALFWSAQAYLINKTVVKPFIDDVVVPTYVNKNPRIKAPPVIQLQFKIVNSFYPKQCTRTRARPCVLANCLFSDTYIYSGAGPSYVFHLPLFNGGKIGYESEIHQNQVHVHKQAFQIIYQLTQQLRNNTRNQLGKQLSGAGLRSYDREGNGVWVEGKVLPPFARPLSCRKQLAQ